MKLSGRAIKHYREKGDIVIDPFDERWLGANSYDLTLAPILLTYANAGPNPTGKEMLDMKKKPETVEHEISEHGVVLTPGVLYLGMTNEIAGTVSGFVPGIEGRSSIARLGISIHETAGFGDVGFVNQWTLEISVKHHIRIYAGVRICQVYFEQVLDVPGEGETINYDNRPNYKSKYNERLSRPCESRLYRDFEDKDASRRE